MNKMHSNYDSVGLLFINKIKNLISFIAPSFDEDNNDSFSCYKYVSSIICERQQIIANM